MPTPLTHAIDALPGRGTTSLLTPEEWLAIFKAKDRKVTTADLWEKIQLLHPNAFRSKHSFEHSYYSMLRRRKEFEQIVKGQTQ